MTRSRERFGRSVAGRATLGWLAGLVAAAAVGAVSLGAPGVPASAAQVGPGGSVTQDAAALYLANCASCHGPKGEGTGNGPTLVGVGPAAVDFYLRTGRMPLGAPGQRPVRQEPRFDDAAIRSLVAYVASFGGDGPAVPQIREGGDVRRGFELYTANCAACHAATGAGNAVGGGFVAVGLGSASDLEIGEAMLVGPGPMPRFSFAPDDRDAIVAYIRYLRSSPTPGGAPIGGIGPVAEGFVSVFLGLTMLVLVARFVGRGRQTDAVPPLRTGR